MKTHILGCPCVMLASPEAAWFVLVTQANLFKPTYPPGKEQLIGRWALFFHQGSYHLQMRKLVQGSLSIDVIRNFVPEIGAIASSCLESWSGGHVIHTFHELKKVCPLACKTISVLLVTRVFNPDGPAQVHIRSRVKPGRIGPSLYRTIILLAQ